MQGLSVISPSQRLYNPAVVSLLARDSKLRLMQRVVASLDSSFSGPRPWLLLRLWNPKPFAISIFPEGWRGVKRQNVGVRVRHGSMREGRAMGSNSSKVYAGAHIHKTRFPVERLGNV